MEVSVGTYSVPVLLTVLLGIIYKVIPTIPDKWKALVAICAGIAIGIMAMFYNEVAFTGRVVIDYILLGLMAGAASVGLYEGVYKTAAKPRE